MIKHNNYVAKSYCNEYATISQKYISLSPLHQQSAFYVIEIPFIALSGHLASFIDGAFQCQKNRDI